MGGEEAILRMVTQAASAGRTSSLSAWHNASTGRALFQWETNR